MRIAVTLLAALLLTLAACPSRPAPAPPPEPPGRAESADSAPAIAPDSGAAAPTEVSAAKPVPPRSDTPEPAAEPADSTQAVELPKLWDFFATWCPPCKEQAPIIEELAQEYKGRIEIISIDTDRNPALAEKFKIKAIPTLVFLDANQCELSRHVGLMSKEEIVAKFREHGFIE